MLSLAGVFQVNILDTQCSYRHFSAIEVLDEEFGFPFGPPARPTWEPTDRDLGQPRLRRRNEENAVWPSSRSELTPLLTRIGMHGGHGAAHALHSESVA